MGHDRPQSTTFEASTPVCIPARWAARRFPGKLLQTLPDGRSVLETTIDIAQRARLGPVLLLAADEDILAAASGWGCRIHRSSQPARNGSERIAAALEDGALGTPPPERIVNLQGDAVGASSELLAAALDALDRHPEATSLSAIRGERRRAGSRSGSRTGSPRTSLAARWPRPTGCSSTSASTLTESILCWRLRPPGLHLGSSRRASNSCAGWSLDTGSL